MVANRGNNIKFDLDSSEDEIDREREVEGFAKPTPKRRRTKTSKPSEEDLAFNPSSSSSKGKEKATSEQKQLITRQNGRGGKLRDLMNMPVDIFTEVCSYLEPYDLRRLALTSKRLWDILMTNEARNIWKNSIASVSDLPECPTDLNEPQYVCLLYSSECYTPGCTSRGTKADWFHRVRFCSACFEEKMANLPSLTFRSRVLGFGLNRDTMSRIVGYFDSNSVMGLAQYYPQFRSRKANERPYYIEAVKKAGHEYDALSRGEAGEYLSRLKEMRDYRVKTGIAMLKWKSTQLASRADDIAAEKNARFQSIKTKLLDMGWNEKDFPISKKEFRDLVFKDQKLTPKIWQSIKPKLEILLEPHRTYRLEMEKLQRRSKRENAIEKLYHRLGIEVINLPFEYYRLGSFLPTINEVFALPSIKPLLEVDTETITKDQWIEVAPDVRFLVLKWWRDCLEKFAALLEHGATGTSNETQTRTGVTNTKVETLETVSSSIASLRATLSYATAVFSCEECCSEKVFRFPHIIEHVLMVHPCYGMDEVLNKLRPLQPNGQELVKRLLKDLNLDPETARLDSPAQYQNENNLLCTRCDERVAKYMSLDQITEHFLKSQKWFERVTDSVRRSPDDSYPSRPVGSQLPKIVNDHDWTPSEELVVRRDNEETKQAVLKLQNDFRKVGLNDPLCDTEGIGGEDLEKHPSREVFRSCLLCPELYAPFPCSTWKIELHIRRKHDKEPNLEQDTTLERRYTPSLPCYL